MRLRLKTPEINSGDLCWMKADNCMENKSVIDKSQFEQDKLSPRLLVQASKTRCSAPSEFRVSLLL